MNLSIQDFIARWRGSAGNEHAHKDSFLRDFCEALELPVPGRKDNSPGYCFEKELAAINPDGSQTTKFIDLYREGAFVLEAKQGSTKASPGSAPQRGTRAYDAYMERGFGQAVNYAIRLNPRPAFILTCDIGHSFHVWESFTGRTGGYGARRSFALEDFRKPEVQDYFRAIWRDPESLDPAKRRARVTREVAQQLGALAAALEGQFPAEAIARFLMRCVFTFFAEDTGLLPERLFESALKGQWQQRPETFVRGLEGLWDAMNSGDFWGPVKVPRFNGGLFQESLALDLAPAQIKLLARAAEHAWEDVDPSIFGTLLESALSAEERHRLGAHYTPRAYIERLLRPALEEPLRADWELAQAEALALLGPEPTDAERARARAVLHRFHASLAALHVLDPACGSGNFLYVAYDILKGLEQEVFSRLQDLGETRQALALDTVMVTPAQFLGLEIKPWAAAIAELVLWIGHLQWYRRQFPGQTPPEPILQRYENIQNRDAVLAWDTLRETGRSRWDGRTFKQHPVTGKDVPDEGAQTAILEYLGARPAPWPEADFIVGNPPFLGNARMREALGDGYAEALRAAYPEVPDTVDFVLYWWHKAALAVRSGRTRRFGLITTNSLRQVRQRGVIAHHCSNPITVHPRLSPVKKRERTGDERGLTVMKSQENQALKLLWAIADHPWTDEGAAVRIAMTVGGLEGTPWLGRVVAEGSAETPEAEAEAVKVEGRNVAAIHEDLSAGANVAEAVALKANGDIATPGVKLHGAGFIVMPEQWEAWGRPAVVHPYRNGRDLTDKPRGVMVIDLYGLKEIEVRDHFPAVYQHVREHVKPERDQNNREIRRRNWWLFGEPNPGLHDMLAGLPHFIATVETAKHRTFQFLDGATVPDNMLIVIASADAFHLGVLSSRFHVVWALAAGGVLEDRPRYNKTRCFDPFPFPEATPAQKQVIRELAERLDAHRKGAQARGVTITGMYNLLEKLRAMGDSIPVHRRSSPVEKALKTGDERGLTGMKNEEIAGSDLSSPAFTVKEREQHALAQTEILRQLHDALDAAVAEAYGWPVDLAEPEILARLVALNRERAAEEARGLVRWLRPEYQAPQAAQPQAAPMLEEEAVPGAPPVTSVAPLAAQPWPGGLKEQLAALRGLLLGSERLWSTEEVAGAFKSRGRYRESIAAHLELLTDLGVLQVLETPAGPRFHRPQALGA